MRVIPLFAVIMVALPYFAHCFCINNKYTDNTNVFVRQVAGWGRWHTIFSRFKHERIGPGESRCCDSSDKSCVKGGDPLAPVKFYIRAYNDGGELKHFEIICPGGGAVTLSGTAQDPKIEAFLHNGIQYKPAIDYDGHTRWLNANLNKTRESFD